MKKITTTGLVVVLLFAGVMSARAARLVAASMARSVTEGTIAEGITDTFPPDAPAIHAVVVFADVAAGTIVRGVWVAVDAIATPNYQIDATALELAAGEARAHFQISKPNSGWPVGSYKLELSVAGVFVTSIPFKVAEPSGGAPTDWAAGRTAPPAPTPAPSVVGSWQCQFSMTGVPLGGGPVSFGADGRATVGGNPFAYQLLPGNLLRLQDATGANDYNYQLVDPQLTMTYGDGSAFTCTRGVAAATPPAYGGRQPAYDQGAERGGQPAYGQQGSGGNTWQLQGTFCHWGGSSNYYSSSDYSSYSSTQRISFDGRGRWAFGSETSFTSDVGNYASGGGGADNSGTYRVAGNQIQYQTAAGEQGVAQVKIRQNDGRITEILVDGDLYAPAVCE